MVDTLIDRTGGKSVPIAAVSAKQLKTWLRAQPAAVRAWIAATGFEAKPASYLLVPGRNGALARVILGVEAGRDIWSYGALPSVLPPAAYRLEPPPRGRSADGASAQTASAAALGWALGSYRFGRYKKNKRKWPRLAWPDGADRPTVEAAVAAVSLVRDLINTPAEDMGPAELAAAAQAVAKAGRASCEVIVGEKLLAKNYPMIHAVGRASSRAPRLIDLRWGDRGPRITLVGKGVCFDSGGLDLKPAAGMLLMKKDMGGAAHMLGLAQMIMAARLPVRLRVLIPAVENSVSGNAYRPLDVIRTRKGLTVEIGNTDAEGRLILCEALTEACRDKPALLIDCATLTGAARVALGADLPALFSNDDGVADDLLRHGIAEDDPLWRLPLHGAYRRLLDSKVADINNVSDSPYGGAITAALFLAEFVDAGTPWVHLDMMAWNLSARPGRPVGGEAVGLRALYGLIAEKAGVPAALGQGSDRPGRGGKAARRGKR